jgi:beta-galactosidase
MVHLLPHWNWSVGTNVTVFAYNNCDSVELFLNDASQGLKTASASTLHLEWNVAWEPGTLRAECRRSGTVAARAEVRTAGVAARIILSADRQRIGGDGRDLVFVTGDIQDATGVIVPTADQHVSFTVSGPGRIVATDNGSSPDTTAFTSTSRRAFSGKVLAIVRSTGAAGRIVVNATSPGLAAGTATITAE